MSIREGILIVEDDYLVATDMEAALVEAGMPVAGVATTGDEAIELADARQPVLAVMDIHLAGARDGVDVALELFARHGIRSVFATAHHDQDVQARAEPARPLAWVQKPYSMQSLVASVRRALRQAAEDE